MTGSPTNAVSRILGEINAGRASAIDLLPVVYEDLRRQARGRVRRLNGAHLLQTTALVHEVAGRLLDHDKTDWSGRAHFFAVAARAMRQVLADAARRAGAAKRGGGFERVSLTDLHDESKPQEIELIALNEALARLADLDERMARVVECRFFGEMSVKEIAHVLEVSVSTVEADWRAARAWLGRELRERRET